MTIAQTGKRIRQTLRIAGEDLINNGKRIVAGADRRLLPQEQEWMKTLRENGVVAIPDFWPREKALAVNERMKQFLAGCHGGDKDFPSGAYARFNCPGKDYGVGIQRLYHAEKEVAELADFRFDPLPLRIAAAYYGRPFHTNLMLFQHNPAGTVDGQYHVDGFKEEFKSFLYLDDVDADNGPFTYVLGSHAMHLRRMKRQVEGKRANGLVTDFTKAEVQDLIDEGREKQLAGKAGTLLLADVRGIHYGSPQLSRSRSVLVNYIMSKEQELQLGR